MGANVDHALQKPQVLHARVAAIGAHGTLICDRLRKIYAGVLETVHARENLGPDDATEGLVPGIRSAIVDMPRGDGGNHPVFVEGHTGVAKGAFIAVRAGGIVLGARFDPLNGPATCFFGCERARGHLRITGDFDTEAAADVERLHTNAVDVNAEMRSDKLNGKRRKRIVAPIIDVLVFGIPMANHCIGFKRRAGKAVKVQLLDTYDMSRVTKGLFDVAVLEDAAPDAIRARLVMQKDFVAESFFGVDDRL